MVNEVPKIRKRESGAVLESIELRSTGKKAALAQWTRTSQGTTANQGQQDVPSSTEVDGLTVCS